MMARSVSLPTAVQRKGTRVQSNDIQDDMIAGFEVSPMPPIGPDGAPDLPPMAPALRPPPRLCEAGPCRHYHRFEIQLEAQQPVSKATPLDHKGERVVVEAAGAPVYHTETHHYCYPNPGIETRLGSLPVLQCNRWSPISTVDELAANSAASEFMESARGQAFLADQAAWQAERDAMVASEQEALDRAAADLAAMPESVPDEVVQPAPLWIAALEPPRIDTPGRPPLPRNTATPATDGPTAGELGAALISIGAILAKLATTQPKDPL